MTAPLRLLDAGECALVAEFGDRIDTALHDRVLALDAALALSPLAGVIETVPTYRSLMVHYDPLVLPRARLAEHLLHLAAAAVGADAGPRRLWRLPACYDADFAEDLAHVAQVTGLPPTEVIRLHASARYRVYMYGFAPGWAYLGGLPAALTLPRRAAPRDRIPSGALIIAGGQAIVAGDAMPSGWHILGRTPARMFAPGRDPAFLVNVGDLITFDPVDRATYDSLSARAAAGEVLARAEPG
jgi:KipI family sensor histidine kinase inhibitor